MNPARRATPDSEAVASSEDEKPWPASMKFGNFAMKENSVPGLPGGIWSTRNQRGSFKLSEEAKLNAARHARLGAVNPTMRAATTPSPSASEGASSLPFAIPLQPTPKTGRSLSHSMGQREAPQTSGPHASSGGHAAALPLGLLAEEVDTESESDLGSRLTHTTSHPPIGSLMRTATLPPTFDPVHGNGKHHPSDQSPQRGLLRGKTFEASFANLSLEQPGSRARWQSHLGWDDVPNVNESRRHSLADIPTRRGSLAAGEASLLSRTFTHDPLEIDEHQLTTHFQPHGLERPERSLDTSNEHPNMTRAQDTAAALDIPLMYRVPYVELNSNERREIEARRAQEQPPPAGPWGSGPSRPRKQLFVVSFKCSRVDVFYLLDNTGLHINEGDLVIVEADRGQDLGTVQHARVTPEAARLYKKKYSEEQYKWLMMYSRNKDGGFNPNAQVHGESSSMGPLFPDAPVTMQGSIPRDNYNNLKPKAIKRLANDHEIKMLAEKEGNEAKAKRTCQQKVVHLRLHMEILDAEWQWDFQKLIFYYYADHYINFKDLITELYRIYKTRIWLSAINPASFSQHAMGQPPSGIGPGAVAPYNPYATNNSYTMAYGEDRDPYGAQMPYRIPYDTYTPNYPAIPGVANSFAPPAFSSTQNFMFYPQTGGQGEDLASANDPLINRTGNMNDYNMYYDRSGQNEHSASPNVSQPDEHKLRAQQHAIHDARSYNQAPPMGAYQGYSLSMDGNDEQGGPGFTDPWRAPSQYNTPVTAGSIRQPRPSQAPIGTRPSFHGTARHSSEQASKGSNSDRSHQTVSHHPTDMRQNASRGQPLEFGNRAGLNNSSSDGMGQATNSGFGADDPNGLLGRYFNQLPSPAEMRAETLDEEHKR